MYIEPNIKLYDTFSDLIKYKSSEYFDSIFKEEKLTIKKLYINKNLFVLAEPGFGKTVLLENLVKNAEANGIEAIFVDLKKLDNSINLYDNINKITKRPDTIKTGTFNISKKHNLLLCLDALDEVSQKDFSNVIDKITDFIIDYPDVRIFISCRILHFEKYENILNFRNFSFLRINHFSYDNVIEYLNKNDIDTQRQDFIKKEFFNNDSIYKSIIYTPRYLNLFVDYLKEKNIEDFKQITRCELFDYFIYKKIEKDKIIQKEVDINILKRVIETLALIMEIYQVNSLSKDELMSFFADIQNDLKVNILSHITIDDFINRSALKDNIDFVEFENTEFQEYLAAKEISRFKDMKQSVFDLAVDKDLKEIYPSWFNVLSFLIELKIDLLKNILDYGMSNQKTVTEGYFDLITKVNSNLLSTEIKDDIFKKVFEYHQLNDRRIKYTLVDNLSYYYTENNSNLLKKYFEGILFSKENRVILKNIFYLIFYICERKLLSLRDINYWSKKYEKILTDKSIEISVKIELLFITKHLNNKKIINIIYELPYQDNEELWEPIISNLGEIKVNENILVHLIINGLKFRSSIYIYCLYNLKSPKAIKIFFDIISKDNYLNEKFLNNYSINDDSESMDRFFKTIKDINNYKIIKSLKNYIIKSCNKKIHSNHRSRFLKKLIRFISSIDKEFIFEIIDSFSKTKDYWNFMLLDIFSECLYKEQVQKFIELTKIQIPEYPWVACSTLYSFKSSDRIDAKEIFEEGKKHFLKEFLEEEKKQKKYKREDEKRERKNYEEFKKWLNISTEKDIIYNIFIDYTSEHSNIQKYISNEEKVKLKSLTSFFLKSYNPLKSGLIYLEETDNETRYRTDFQIGPYGYAIICAEMLNLDVSNYRQNIINYIPFAYSDHFQAIIKIIGNISVKELEPVIKIYRCKKDDLWRHMPNNLFYIANNYTEIIPKIEHIFVDYLEGKHTHKAYNYQKIDAIKILDKYHNNIKYLKGLKNKDINDNALTNEVNAILISKYNDVDTILERINYIIDNPFEFEFEHHTRGYSPDEHETEIRNKYFAAPLMKLEDDSFIDYFLKLLEESYKVYKKDGKYGQYAYYMSEIVIAYFNNLKHLKDIRILKKLEVFNNKFINEVGYGIMLERIGQLKKEYLDYIGKPDNINTCINKYNKIKNEQYQIINNNYQLFELLKDIIEKDLNDWIKIEGRKMLESIKNKGREETELQKWLKLQFDNLLLRKEFRPNDFYVYRESQSLDDSRTDFLIGYGFVNPVLIELKLSSNPDMKGNKLTSKKSFTNMKKYIKISDVENAIFLVYNNNIDDNELWDDYLKNINDTYKQIKEVTVIGIPK
jgi:hypothetical protein